MSSSRPGRLEKESAHRLEPPVGAGSVAPRGRIGADGVGVNLRFFRRSHECFSDWQKKELKQFALRVEKMARLTEAQAMSDNYGHAHRGDNAATADLLPRGISGDTPVYSMRVTRKARVHGFFSGGDFYLIALDRNHRVLPS
ncbi:MAG: hypothetical protein MPJ82_04540 [Alphaproteobacteria bacterium]|nr:hypothetical protein [Alphaproteobacteria bacterium]